MSSAQRWVATWKDAGRVMEEIRIDTLRHLDEQESAKWFNDLDTSPENIWRRPEQCEGRGLVEQQRLFSRLHAH
ncbi:MAG: hypothetical protein WCO94_16320 [Verrucomicrobiota bacterium]